jgi:extracellular elastinolytic metalloproteinase
VYTSPHDAFPGDPPRPVAPHLILRRFDVPDFKATHVKLVVKTNQCTGAPSFQGDQDADPANNPDCDTNVPGNSARNFVRAAELQVFSHRPDNND